MGRGETGAASQLGGKKQGADRPTWEEEVGTYWSGLSSGSLWTERWGRKQGLQ